jgi:hypothetical protein
MGINRNSTTIVFPIHFRKKSFQGIGSITFIYTQPQ